MPKTTPLAFLFAVAMTVATRLFFARATTVELSPEATALVGLVWLTPTWALLAWRERRAKAADQASPPESTEKGDLSRRTHP